MLRFKQRQEEKKLGFDDWAQRVSWPASTNRDQKPAPRLPLSESSLGAPGRYVSSIEAG